MEKWLSISQLSEITGIPETTVRRYTNKFINYFRYEKRSRGKKFHPGSVEVLNRIAALYADDYEAMEIENALAKDFPINIGNDEETTKQPPAKSIEQQFNEFKEQQEEFNKKLLQELKEQQNYIKNSIDKRDHELMNTLNEMQETRRALVASQEENKKRWWQFWRK